MPDNIKAGSNNLKVTQLDTPVFDAKTATREEIKARVRGVLERGYIIEKLNVKLPDDLTGQWVSNDPVEISRLESMGYKIDDTYAVGSKLHSDGTNTPIVGDVIFMTAPKIVKEVHDEVVQERIRRNNKTRGNSDEAVLSQIQGAGLQTVNESSVSNIDIRQV